MENINKIVHEVSQDAVCGINKPKTIFEINMVKTFEQFGHKLLEKLYTAGFLRDTREGD